jgi:two-component system, OmpR family, response regulator
MKVLILENDFDVAHEIIDALEQAGHAATHFTDDRDGLKLANSGFDLIILDRILSNGIDGLDVLKTLREAGDLTPVMIVSGLGSVQDRVDGLKAGANDYLAKPVALAELVARVDAVSQPRKDSSPPTSLSVGDVEIDLLSRNVVRAGKRIDLQPREYKLLEYFMRNPGRVITRKELLEKIWKTRFDPGTSVIEVHLSRLRKKIDSPFGAAILYTIRNVGFMMRPVERAKTVDALPLSMNQGFAPPPSPVPTTQVSRGQL